nr:hypothetical protein [Streptomyces sp. SID5474]
VLVPFAGYAFNKSHSAAYGLVSYQTAYLKANFPAEYMAALLTSVGDEKDKMGMYLADARSAGIRVLSPDVNESVADFTAVGSDVRFGLRAIRNVGDNVINDIVEARTSKGKFNSFADFLTKIGLPACNKRAVESLVRGEMRGHHLQDRVRAAAVDAGARPQGGLRERRSRGDDGEFGGVLREVADCARPSDVGRPSIEHIASKSARAWPSSIWERSLTHCSRSPAVVSTTRVRAWRVRPPYERTGVRDRRTPHR